MAGTQGRETCVCLGDLVLESRLCFLIIILSRTWYKVQSTTAADSLSSLEVSILQSLSAS